MNLHHTCVAELEVSGTPDVSTPRGRFRSWVVGHACRVGGTVLSALGLALAAEGCGPVMYTANIFPAAHAVEEARFAGAADSAPYEYYLAAAYLEKAQACAGRGDYQDAIRFAEVAEDNARKARDLARRHMRETGR